VYMFGERNQELRKMMKIEIEAGKTVTFRGIGPLTTTCDICGKETVVDIIKNDKIFCKECYQKEIK
ncbi:unnamed protein product, partial [marine sediment metagenome]